jgi:hypothetical protein
MTLRGIVRGRTIELSSETGLSDGQPVELDLREISDQRPAPGEGIRSSAGVGAFVPGAEEAWAEIERQRRLEVIRAVPEGEQ